jgi:hypothetical protein
VTTFNMDGPHSPELTRKAAAQIAHLARYLNYATLGDVPGLEFPSDLDLTIGSLASAAGLLPQFLGQCAPWLEALGRSGRLYDDHGHDPLVTAVTAAGHLGHAAHLAGELAEALRAARNEIARLGVKETPDDLR